MKDENRPILRFDCREDDYGMILKPVYLTETPKTEIERLNKLFKRRK